MKSVFSEEEICTNLKDFDVSLLNISLDPLHLRFSEEDKRLLSQN